MVDAMSQALNRFIFFDASLTKKKQTQFNFESERPKPHGAVGIDVGQDFINYSG
jgi:hypothetical protein